MCTCGGGQPCNVFASQHCSSVLIRITPQPLSVCQQTLRSYLKGHPLKTPCKLDVKAICDVLCIESKTNPGLYEHRYDAVCNEIKASCTNFQDVGVLLMKHGVYLSLISFRHFCETIPKFSQSVFFHPQHRHLVCARGRINVYNKKSLHEGVTSVGSSGIALVDLGGSYKGAGTDIVAAIEAGLFVIVCNRLYSTNVAPLATPGALEQWMKMVHSKPKT